MKKTFTLIFTLLSISIFAGELKDGKYWVEDAEYQYGWKSFTAITVEKGEVASAKHDKFNPDGNFASEDNEYNTNMKAKSGSNPAEFSKILVEEYLTTKDIDKVDTVAGATSSSNIFRMQMKFLLEKAEKGESGKFVK